MTTIVVIGADAAGASAASQVKRRQPDWNVIVLERSEFTSFAACGLPYWISGDIDAEAKLIARSPEKHRANGLDLRTGHEVTSLDAANNSVTVRHRGAESQLNYDHLIIATGAAALAPEALGAGADNVAVVHDIPDARGIRALLNAQPQQAVVVGAGYIGIEMVEALAAHGIEVTWIDQTEGPMATLDPDMSAQVSDFATEMGVRCEFGAQVSGVQRDVHNRVTTVSTSRGDFATDLVILALGVRPATKFAQDAGLAVGTSGGLITDAAGKVRGTDNIWAAGDCVESYHRLRHTTVHVPLGTHANKQGRVVGVNVSGGYLTFPGIIGTAITKLGSLHIARTGLSTAEAQDMGYQVIAAQVNTAVIAHYMPDHGTMTTRLIVEKNTGRVLGGQIIGDRVGAAKRIDTIAMAVWHGMTAEELTGTDLAYAPPHSPVWDPVQVAARRAADLAAR